MVSSFTPTTFTDHSSVIDAAFLNSFQTQVKNITDEMLARRNTVIMYGEANEPIPSESGRTINLPAQGILQRAMIPLAGDIVLDVHNGTLGIVSHDAAYGDADFDVTSLGLSIT